MANLILTPHTPTGGLSGPALTEIAGATITLSPAAQRSRATTDHPGSRRPDIQPGIAYRFSVLGETVGIASLWLQDIERNAKNNIWKATWTGTDPGGATRAALANLNFVATAIDNLVITHPAYDALDILAGAGALSRGHLRSLIEDDIGDIDHDRTADREQVGLEYQVALSKPAFGTLIAIPLIARGTPTVISDPSGWAAREPGADPPETRIITCQYASPVQGRVGRVTANPSGSLTGLEVEKPARNLAAAKAEILLQMYRMRRRWRTGGLTLPFDSGLTAGRVISWAGTDTWIATEVRHRLEADGVSLTTLALADMPILSAPPFSL